MSKHRAVQIESLVSTAERDLRNGHAARVVALLKGIGSISGIDREQRIKLANLSRRVGLFSFGLRVLSEFVRPSRSGFELSGSDDERAEYAVLLMKNGSVGEALAVLKSIDVGACPQALLYQAFCHIASWDYEQARADLEQYLHKPKPKPQHKMLSVGPNPANAYTTMIARVNLAACLVMTERLASAEELLLENIMMAQAGGHLRLLANCYELRAQTRIEANQLEMAQADLERASQILSGAQTADQLFVMQWRACIESRRTGRIDALETFRAEALRRSHWESVRESDFQLLKVDMSASRYRRLLFGTAYLAYRERLAKLDIETGAPVYHFGQGGQEVEPAVSGITLDLRTARVSDEKFEVSAGRQAHRLIEVLLRDFYRPQRVGAMFAHLFPQETYNAFSSPNRVHKAISRVRTWIREQALPVEITQRRGLFQIEVKAGLTLLVPLHRKEATRPATLMHQLQEAFPNRQMFSAREAREKLGMTEPTFRRFLVSADARRQLIRTGAGKTVVYHWQTSKKTAA